MNSRLLKLIALSLAASLLAPGVADSAVYQWIRIGGWQYRVTDSGANSETHPGGISAYYYNDRGGFTKAAIRWRGVRYGCLDPDGRYEEASGGTGYMFSGHGYGSTSEEIDQWAIGDDDPLAATITSYWRQRPPLVIVQGRQLSEPFPYPGTVMEVDPSKIPGTADVLVESFIRNRMGLEIHQKVLSWSREDYDDFYISEYHITNTGNIDRDEEIELTATMQGLYLWHQASVGIRMWSSWQGMQEGDSLRIWYLYPGASSYSYPSNMGISGPWGQPAELDNFSPRKFIGNLTLFAESAALDNTDWWAQPVVHSAQGPDYMPIKAWAGNTAAGVTFDDWDEIYTIMARGVTDPNSGVPPSTYNGYNGELVMMQDNPLYTLRADAGLYHETPTEDRQDMLTPSDVGWSAAFFSMNPNTSFGPYDLPIGETLTYVFAWVAGGISEEMSRTYGPMYEAGTLKDDTTLPWDTMDDPPINVRYPELITEPGVGVDENVRRKDKLIYSGRDTLLMHAMAAKYAYENNYDIPIAPPAPDVAVTSLNYGIQIDWDGTQSETVADFDGYRIYRAVGGVDSVWTLIHDFQGTGTYTYLDTYVERDKSYYYCVVAYDDGMSNGADYFNPAYTPLESGMLLNRTTAPAYINYGPAAVNDAATALSGQIVAIDVLANDTDPDGDVLTIAGAKSRHGGAAGDTILNYVSLPGFSGVDTIRYIVTDGKFGFYDTASVIMTVTEHVSDPPVLMARTYGGSYHDRGYSVQQTNDGGYIITGYTRADPEGDDDLWLVKTDATGDTLWTSTFGGSDRDYGYSVQQTTDKGYIVAGYTWPARLIDPDIWLLRMDARGDTLWTRTFGGSNYDYGYSVRQTGDKGYIIAGDTYSFGAGGYDVWLIKTNAIGDTVWTRTFGGGSTDYGRSIQQTADGGYIIAGDTYSFGAGGYDAWLIKTDAQGDTLWTRTFGGSDYDYGYSVQQTTDDGYIIVGYTESLGAGGYDAWLIKTDAQGNEEWNRTFGGDENDYGYSVRQTTDGGFVITGETASYVPGSAAWLIRTDADGDTLWTRTFGGVDSDAGRSVELTADGDYIMTGYTYSFGAGGADVLLIKVSGETPAAIDDGASTLPQQFALHQNYPNPFNPTTILPFDLPVATEVSIVVYDLLGREIARLVDGHREAGYHQVVWNSRDADGREVPTGMYIARLVTPTHSQSIKLVLLR